MTSYVFVLSQAQVSWRSTLQSIVALSTTKAKYMVMTEAIKEGIDLGIEQDQLGINCDSMSAICLMKNQVYHAQMKYINVRY